MINKIKNLPVLAYLAMVGFLQELKNDERGLSGVVVTILLILVAVLAVALIWYFLGDWLDTIWQRITGEVDGGFN